MFLPFLDHGYLARRKVLKLLLLCCRLRRDDLKAGGHEQFSLFCVVVCAVAQPANSAVHTIAIRAINCAASALTFVAISGLVGPFTLPDMSSLE